MELAPTASISALLRQARTERGLSVREVASKTQISKSSISRWEGGHGVPSAQDLNLLAPILGLPNILKPATESTWSQLCLDPASLLRAMRGRAEASISQVAEMVGVSKSLVSRWESRDRSLTPDRMLVLAKALGATKDEMEVLNSVRFCDEADLDFQTRFNRLKKAVRTGSKSVLDLEFLTLDASLSQRREKDDEAFESQLKLRGLYVEWLGWWYRDREAAHWAHQQLQMIRERPELAIWGRSIRARNVFMGEFGPKEPKRRINNLGKGLEILKGKPSEAFVRRELASELIGQGRSQEALDQVRLAKQQACGEEDAHTHNYCCAMVESGAWLQLGQVEKARATLPGPCPNDQYLGVSSAVGRSKVLWASGEKSAAREELQQAHIVAKRKGYTHFARTAQDELTRIAG